jgi:hypothetical protein
MTTSKEVQDAFDKLSTYIRGVKATTQRQKSERAKAGRNLELIREYLETAKTVEPDTDESQATSIEGFFNAVGTGVREAQESLDMQSIQYMRNSPAFAPETMFRVPKVSANLKLGMTYSEETGINFLVIKRGSETSRSMEQEISFDIVSAPPPPDTLEKYADLPIDPILVTSAIEREWVMERLKKEKKDGNHAGTPVGEIIGAMLQKDAFRRVLVIRGEKDWTLMLVEPPDKRLPPPSSPSKSASVLVLPVEQEDGVLKSLIANQRMNHFYNLLFPIADKQTQLLTDLDRI